MPESVSCSNVGHRSSPLREAVFELNWMDIEAIGWGELLTHCRDAEIREIKMLEGDCCQCVCELEVGSLLDDVLLTELECVDQWEFLAEADDAYLYLLEVTAPELPDSIHENHEKLIGTCEPTVSEHGITMSILGPQEQIREVMRNYETVGITPNIRKISEYRGEVASHGSLTDRQLQVIETAYDLGFYEIPRQATTEIIADELDIKAATVSEHLQRGERNLLRQKFAKL